MATRLLREASQGPMRRGREVKQLDIGYAGSSLALDRCAGGRVVTAGGRAPDALCRGAGGLPRRLFELFRGTHWTLLCHGPLDAASAPPARAGLHRHVVGETGDILDVHGEFRAHYGVEPGDWVLVRPDGYIGAMLTSGDTAALESFLGSVGLGGAAA
jgi:hypothetical protein